MFRMIARYQPFSPTVTRKPDAAGRSVWKLETRPAAISIGDSPKVATSAGLKVCYRKLPGKHMLFLSFTCFDPNPTSGNCAASLQHRSLACSSTVGRNRLRSLLRKLVIGRLRPLGYFGEDANRLATSATHREGRWYAVALWG